MNYKTRQAKPKDIADIYDIITRSMTEVCVFDYESDPQFLEQWLTDKTPEQIKKWVVEPEHYTIVVEGPDSVVAGVAMMTADGEIHCNHVAPEFLGQGLGRQLLTAMEDYCKKLSQPWLTIFTTKTAKSFFENSGFILAGEPIYSGTAIGELPMLKAL